MEVLLYLQQKVLLGIMRGYGGNLNIYKKKMKIVQINSQNFGSTGTIMRNIAHRLISLGHESYLCYPKKRSCVSKYIEGDILIGNNIIRNFEMIILRRFPIAYFIHYISTKLFIIKLRRIKPDVVHLHNLHALYLNIPLLFKYLSSENIKVIWTLHDCWAFTGHCPHFEYEQCFKWKQQCNNCEKYLDYPSSKFDDSSYMYNLKKQYFSTLKDLTIVTPSVWLANYARESFFKEKKVVVINNGVDISSFGYIGNTYKKKIGAENKILLLGVSMGWFFKKGIDVFIELAKMLPSEKYQIVLVGTDDNIDKTLPSNIISIHRTSSIEELKEIYSAADYFVNPTREENFPTVNIESLACGTPVITFNTGGSPEIVDYKTGIVINDNTVDSLYNSIVTLGPKTQAQITACLDRAKMFSGDCMANSYIDLYID